MAITEAAAAAIATDFPGVIKFATQAVNLSPIGEESLIKKYRSYAKKPGLYEKSLICQLEIYEETGFMAL